MSRHWIGVSAAVVLGLAALAAYIRFSPAVAQDACLDGGGAWRSGECIREQKAAHSEVPVDAVMQGTLTRNGSMNARAAFDVDLPDDCQMTTRGLMVDYQVFNVTCGKRDYAGVYVGNFGDATVPRSRTLSTQFGWPTQVQVWSNAVPGDQARADAIAASVSLRALK